MRLRPLALLPVACSFAALSTASAQDRSASWIPVVDIRSLDAAPQAQVLTDAIKRDLGRAAAPSVPLDTLLGLAGCGPAIDGPCVDRMAAKLDTGQLVWGLASRTAPGKLKLELHMFVRGEPQRFTELTLDEAIVVPGHVQLQNQLHQALASIITRGGQATLRLQVGHLDGQVLVDGRPATDLRSGVATLSLRGGEHAIEVRCAGQPPMKRTVFLQPLTTTDLSLTPEPEAPGSPATATNWYKTLGWGSIGAGAVFTALGYVASWKVSRINEDPDFVAYRESTADGDVCESAKDGKSVNGISASTITELCDRGKSYERLSWVGYGLGAGGILAGISLLVIDPGPARKADDARFRLFPVAGANGGQVQARWTF